MAVQLRKALEKARARVPARDVGRGRRADGERVRVTLDTKGERSTE